MMVRIPKYAQLENERRFLITECPDLSMITFRLIEDLYVSESRLRLRAITHTDGQQQEFKFCKKYPSDDIGSGAIVNVYLTADEHRTLSQLPGRRIRKRRYSLDFAATTYSLDVFEDQLAGLVLCEVEAASAASLELIVAPTWAQYEVTDDPFFTGGNLVNISASALRAKLSSMAEI
jgi:CYTH domain-containing protein